MENKTRKWISFAEAREFSSKLGLEKQSAWYAYCKSGEKPSCIPASPSKTYKDEWMGWPYWLGTEKWSYDLCKCWMEANAPFLISRLAYEKYHEMGQLPVNMRCRPKEVFGDAWKGWKDYLPSGGGEVPEYLREIVNKEIARRSSRMMSKKWYAAQCLSRGDRALKSHLIQNSPELLEAKLLQLKIKRCKRRPLYTTL